MTMKNTNIKLDERFNAFISNQIQEGHYESARDVVQTALCLLEEHEVKLNSLKAKLSASERQADNNQFVNYSAETLIEEIDQESVA